MATHPHPHAPLIAHHTSTVANEIVGIGFWAPVKAIAETLFRIDAAQMGATGAVLIGLSVHLAVSVVGGVLFALIAPREVAPAPALAFGTFAGVTTLVLMNLIILPIVNPQMRSHLLWGSTPGAIPVVVAFAMHLTYGAGLALAPMLRRRFNAT